MIYYLLICWLVTTVICENRTSYEGFQVYRLQPTNTDQIRVLSSLASNGSYDFWSPINFDHKPIDVMIDPRSLQDFVKLLQNNRIQFRTLIDNVETSTLKEELFQKLLPRKSGISFTRFHRYDEITEYLQHLSETYPNLVKIESIGNSYEGRQMPIVQISTNFHLGKPIIFIDAGIHAREWLAPSQALFIIEQLVENKTNRYLLQKADWHILPLANPDGYEYSHDYNPYWRKTRSYQDGCYGVDANRNFDIYWGRVGVSRSPCANTYLGSQPFSEIETRNIRDHINYYSGTIKLYLTLHSYGNYILYPWGYTAQLPENAYELHNLAEGVNRAIMAAGGQGFTVGSSTNVLYAAAGGSDDWAKAKAGIALSYTIELPGGRQNGFHPDGDEIYQFVSQTFAGIIVFGKYVALKFG